jgi:hypothetical protein
MVVYSSRGRYPGRTVHLGDDAKDEHNLASDPKSQPMLDRMRQAVGKLTAGPLLPERFRT